MTLLVLLNLQLKGEYEKYNLLLGHRRLSIIDLSINGHQPMFFNDNCITFNGEIYNYIEIRQNSKPMAITFLQIQIQR